MVEQDLDSESDDEVEVCVAEMLNGKAYVCPALSSPNSLYPTDIPISDASYAS